MYQVFNMGHRMELFTTEEGRALIQEAAAPFGVDVRVVGRVEKGRGKNELHIESPVNLLSWNL